MKSEGQVKEGYHITYSEFCNSDHQTKAQGMRDNKWVSDLCFNLVTQNVYQWVDSPYSFKISLYWSPDASCNTYTTSIGWFIFISFDLIVSCVYSCVYN